MATPNTYIINETVRLSVIFNNGSNYDPTSVTAFVMSPTNVESSYAYGTDSALQKDAQGLYHIDVVPNVAGIWTYRWEGAGPTNTAAETTFFAAKSQFYS